MSTVRVDLSVLRASLYAAVDRVLKEATTVAASELEEIADMIRDQGNTPSYLASLRDKASARHKRKRNQSKPR